MQDSETRSSNSNNGRQETALTYGNKKPPLGLLMGQLAVTIALSLLLLMFGWQAAASAMIGGAIAMALMLLQLWGMMRPYRAQSPGAIVGAMVYVAAVKMALAGALFALAFKGLTWVAPYALFAGFIISYLAPWLIIRHHETGHPKHTEYL